MGAQGGDIFCPRRLFTFSINSIFCSTENKSLFRIKTTTRLPECSIMGALLFSKQCHAAQRFILDPDAETK